MSEDKLIEQYSEYPELKLPNDGFKSEIPEFLLEGSSKQEVFIMESLSKLNQALEWNTKATIDLSNGLRKTNGKVYKTLDRVTKLESKEVINKSDIEEIKKELGENRESLTDIKGIRSLLSKRWFLLGAALIAIFVLFFIYPYLLATTTYKDVIEVLKGLF